MQGHNGMNLVKNARFYVSAEGKKALKCYVRRSWLVYGTTATIESTQSKTQPQANRPTDKPIN